MGRHRRLRQRRAVLQVLHHQRDEGHPDGGEDRRADRGAGTFKGGNYIGTLANGGVALSPYHDFASKIPAALQTEIAKIKAGIISGKIKTPTKSPV